MKPERFFFYDVLKLPKTAKSTSLNRLEWSDVIPLFSRSKDLDTGNRGLPPRASSRRMQWFIDNPSPTVPEATSK